MALKRETPGGVAVARAAAAHDHVVDGIVVLLFDLVAVVQQVITCGDTQFNQRLAMNTVHA